MTANLKPHETMSGKDAECWVEHTTPGAVAKMRKRLSEIPTYDETDTFLLRYLFRRSPNMLAVVVLCGGSDNEADDGFAVLFFDDVTEGDDKHFAIMREIDRGLGGVMHHEASE